MEGEGEGCQGCEPGEGGGDAEAAYEERLRRCMVQVEVDLPLVALADGVHSSSFAGARRVRGSCMQCRVWRIAARCKHCSRQPITCTTIRCAHALLVSNVHSEMAVSNVSHPAFEKATFTPRQSVFVVAHPSAKSIHASNALSAGTGLVVHHDESIGLVLVDRNTAAIGLGDVTLSFGAYPAEARGVVRFLHPLHNFAFISYDTADLNAEV